MNRITTLSTDFNPRSRKGSDEEFNNDCKTYHISIHAPARGATIVSCDDFGRFDDFNPRSRKGSDADSGDEWR